MPLLVHIRPNASRNKPERLQACSGNILGAGLLQICCPMVPMSSTTRAKVKLEVVMGGHDMSGMDFGGTK